jgi:hypothetical protein
MLRYQLVAMIKKSKGIYLFLYSILITVIHLPFAVAKSASTGAKYLWSRVEDSLPMEPVKNAWGDSLLTSKTVLDSIHHQLNGLSQQAYYFAKKGFDKLLTEGKLLNDSLIAIVDFSQPSSHNRLYVLDVKNYRLLFNCLVAHGKNSGKEKATSFSNQSESYKSSSGFYITGATYQGKNGYSLKLNGIEAGINNNAYARGIVVHGADYVSQEWVKNQGFIGRSQGCPAVPLKANHQLIELIKNGVCFFVYHPTYVYSPWLLN